MGREGAETKDQGGFNNGLPGRGTLSPATGSSALCCGEACQEPARCLSSRHCLAAQKEPVVLTAPRACQLQNKEGELTPRKSLPNPPALPLLPSVGLYSLQTRNNSVGNLSFSTGLRQGRLRGGHPLETVKMSKNINPVDHVSNPLHYPAELITKQVGPGPHPKRGGKVSRCKGIPT